jgi:hypothetical protein
MGYSESSFSAYSTEERREAELSGTAQAARRDPTRWSSGFTLLLAG